MTVGTLLAQRDSRTKVWEVIATAHGPNVRDADTLWLRLREVNTGEELTLPPRGKTGTCVVLTRDPLDEQTAPPTEPTDTEAILLVVKELGAMHLASRDHETGQVVCPDYTETSHINDGAPNEMSRGLTEHLRFAHKMSVDDGLDIVTLMALHAQGHDPKWPLIGKGGFAHRHLPEVDILTDFVLRRRAPGIPIRVSPKEAS